MNNLYYEFHRDYNNNIYCFKGINYCNKHFYQQLELLYVLEDQIEVCINNKNKILKKNQIAISDCFDNHTYYFNNKKSMVLIIPLQYLKKYSNYMLNKQLSTNYILEEEKTLQIKKILEAIYENQNENSLLLSGYINVLLGLIIKFIPLIEPLLDTYRELIDYCAIANKISPLYKTLGKENFDNYCKSLNDIYNEMEYMSKFLNEGDDINVSGDYSYLQIDKMKTYSKRKIIK